MSTATKWILWIALGLFILSLVVPFVWQAVSPDYGYGMMGFGRGHMGGYGYGMMPFGMAFMWLIPVGLLVLIVLAIAALVKYLMKK